MQQSGLPFDPTSLSVQPNQYRHDSPPCVPQGIIVVPQLQHLIVPACALIANEATSSCQAHSGRTFLFNQLAANGYNNRDFGMAVSTALDLLMLGMVRNQYRTPEEGLQDAVRKAMTFVSALNFQKYPVLQQYVSPDIWNSAVQVLNQMPQVANEVTQAKNNLQQPQTNFNMGAGMGGGMSNYPQQNVWRGNQQPQFAQQGGYPQPTQHYPGTQAVASSLFGSGHVAAIQPIQTGPVAVDNDRYAYLRKTVEPINQVQVKQVYNKGQSTNTNNSTFVKEPEKAGLVWTSSPAQPYIMSIDPRTQRLGLKEIVWSDNETYVISYPITLTEKEAMDRKQHSIGLVAEAIIARPTLNNVPRELALEAAIDKLITKPLGSLDEEFIDEIKNKEQTSVVVESFLEAAIFAGRVNMRKTAIEDDTAEIAFQTTAIITEPVLTTEDATDFIERLAGCTTYQRMVDTLTTGLSDPNTANLCAKIDKVFTKQINSMLRNTMSISDTVGTFISDAVPLIDHLNKKFGDQMAKAYLAQQGTFTAVFFDVPHFMTDDTVDDISSKLNLNIEDDGALPVSFITQRNTLTYIDAHSSEVGIEPNAKYGSSILQSNHPLLYQLVKNIFDKDDTMAYRAAHHLLITVDNVIFEFHKGLIGTDFYTVSEYK